MKTAELAENTELEMFYKAFSSFMKDKRDELSLDNLKIKKIHFTSKHIEDLMEKDKDIHENENFSVPFIQPKGETEGIVVFGHGLNEGDYTKIVPWMYSISKLSKLSSTIFPTSFHLGRRPPSWTRRAITAFRKRSRLLGNRTSSPMNAVLSERLDEAPERFTRGARQSYKDFISFLEILKKTDLPLYFLGYSLTGFLVLSVLADKETESFIRPSKSVIFCSGSSFEDSDPESPLILDRLAVLSLKNYLKNFKPKKEEKSDIWIENILKKGNKKELREGVKRVRNKLLIIAGKDDRVTPKNSIEENLGTTVDLTLDLGIHEVPFTATEKDLLDQKALHKKLRNCYMVEDRFKKVYKVFIESVLDFFSF